MYESLLEFLKGEGIRLTPSVLERMKVVVAETGSHIDDIAYETGYETGYDQGYDAGYEAGQRS